MHTHTQARACVSSLHLISHIKDTRNIIFIYVLPSVLLVLVVEGRITNSPTNGGNTDTLDDL
jgi:hypothetical protein